MNQNFHFEPATKEQVKARIAIVGPTGSGKTYTGLLLATHLGDNVAVVDTENGSASRYADEFTFQRLNLTQHDPRLYVEAIRAAEAAGFDALVIDSLSHAWAGRGGALDMASDASVRYNNNRWAAWRDVTPHHNALVDALVQCQCHLIVTMRAKTEWVVEEEDGKSRPRKIGLAPVQRDGLEYEMDIVGDMDQNHHFIVSKTRCRALDNAVIHEPGADLAQTILDWLNDGTPEPEPDSEAYQTRFKHFQALGHELYEDKWDEIRQRNVERITDGEFTSAKDLTYAQIQKLISGMYQVKAQRLGS